MTLHVVPLKETWFSILNLAGLGLESWRYASLDSLSVIDGEKNILFCQLGATHNEMRDGDYRFLLQIGVNIYTVSWFEQQPRLVVTGDPSAKNWTGNFGYPLPNSVAIIANEARALLSEASLTVKPTVSFLRADGTEL